MSLPQSYCLGGSSSAVCAGLSTLSYTTRYAEFARE